MHVLKSVLLSWDLIQIKQFSWSMHENPQRNKEKQGDVQVDLQTGEMPPNLSGLWPTSWVSPNEGKNMEYPIL